MRSNEPFAPPVYAIQRATKPFTLDGKLDKPFWEDAAFTADFQDIEGALRETPRFQTRAKMLWDDENIYIGAELIGDEIWATVDTFDEVIFHDNDFEVFIDTDSDTQQYIEFEMNAMNTQWDLFLPKAYRDGGNYINSFDIKGLRSAVHIEGELNNPSACNKRWTVEIVMPFRSLMDPDKFSYDPPKVGDYWRMNFSRVQWTVDIVNNQYVKRLGENGKPLPEDNWVWAPTGVINIHYPEYWAFAFFADGDETYAIPTHEYTRHDLYRMYYEQHRIFKETGAYSTDGAALARLAGVETVPSVEATSTFYEMVATSSDGKTITLYADGRSVVR